MMLNSTETIVLLLAAAIACTSVFYLSLMMISADTQSSISVWSCMIGLITYHPNRKIGSLCIRSENDGAIHEDVIGKLIGTQLTAGHSDSSVI